VSADLLALFNSLDDTAQTRERYVRMPFGYPGNKADSCKYILPRLPYRKKYIEPFGGSGAVLAYRNPSPMEVFNDRFAGVVAFYRCIRDQDKCNALGERLKFFLHSREEFIWCKETWKNCEDDVERGARWYYMHQMSFANQGRHFGRSLKNPERRIRRVLENVPNFQWFHDRFLHVNIENQDWRQCLKDFDSPDAVFYMDPTYLNATDSIYEHELKKEEHKEMLDRVFHMEGFVAMSHYDHELYRKYAWSDTHSWEVNVSMLGLTFQEENNLKGHEHLQRQKATEVLWIKEAKYG
jgi:DNA adenine methylase